MRMPFSRFHFVAIILFLWMRIRVYAKCQHIYVFTHVSPWKLLFELFNTYWLNSHPNQILTIWIDQVWQWLSERYDSTTPWQDYLEGFILANEFHLLRKTYNGPSFYHSLVTWWRKSITVYCIMKKTWKDMILKKKLQDLKYF